MIFPTIVGRLGINNVGGLKALGSSPRRLTTAVAHWMIHFGGSGRLDHRMIASPARRPLVDVSKGDVKGLRPSVTVPLGGLKAPPAGPGCVGCQHAEDVHPRGRISQ